MMKSPLTDIGRRVFLERFAKAVFGVSLLPAAPSLKAAAPQSNARAKSVIFLYLRGGISHIDTFDPKPGKAEMGGVKTIPTSADGVQISEWFPRMARQEFSNRLADGRGIGNARQLLKFLRNDSRLDAARVVLLVARAGDAPVSEFMREFDISDYKAEQELTPCGLSATITAAMLSFDRIRVLSERNESLEHQVRERTAELQRANESLKMFSHSVAHDLRAPLRHVAGFARILQSQLGARLDDESRKSMERITHAANHMGQLLNDLIEFLRVGYMPVNRAPVDFNKLVPQILHELKPEMGDRVIAWCISELPSAPMDRMLAHKMLKHLLQNAIKFTSKTPETRIEIGVLPREEPERVTVFYVRDNGAGFDMQCAAKLFQPFMRLHAQHEFAGNGIGLALVHGIIQRHGGKTWVEAQAGTGTTVYFSLPG